MTQMLELSDRDFKITIINILKGSNGKDGKYERTDGKFQQRDKSYKSVKCKCCTEKKVSEMNFLDGLIGRADIAEEFMNLKICQ